jgi:hypothetical protein
MATEAKLGSDHATLLPWRWAETLRSCSLFWIPVKLGSIPQGQREWLLEFLARLATHLSDASGLHGEHFMQMRVIDNQELLRKKFLNSVMCESPLLGRIWQPRGKPPTPATEEEVQLLATRKKEFSPYDYAPEQAWWFLSRDETSLRERYLGYGGMTVFLVKQEQDGSLPPPPSVADVPMIIPKFLRNDPSMRLLLEDFNPQKSGQIPAFLRNHRAMKPVFANFDVDKLQKKNESLMSPFRELTKEVFGVSMPRDLEFESIPFILPRLGSQDFFTQSDEKIRRWFDVFDVYINESPEDEGIIMACKDRVMPLVASIVEEMRQNGYRYWEG